MLDKIKYGAGLLIMVVVITAMFALSIKTREDLTQSSAAETVGSGTANEIVTPAVATNRNGFGPDETPVSEQSGDFGKVEFPRGKALFEHDFALLDSLNFREVRDVQISGGRAILATAGGVLEFYFEDSSFAVYSYPHGLDHFDAYAILADKNDTYVGTDGGVYLIDELGVAVRIWNAISDTVIMLNKRDSEFYVGTRNTGLWRISGDTIDQILSGKSVTGVTKDKFGLWAATAEGLYSNDGNGWKKRFLKSDSTAFDSISGIASAFGQTWVGTQRGIYHFNGGVWARLDSTQNLFDQRVTALTLGRKYLYIGTEHSGLFSFFEGCEPALSPLDWSEGLSVSSLDVDNGNYLVGLQRGGAILKTAKGEYNILDVICQTEGLYSSLNQ